MNELEARARAQAEWEAGQIYSTPTAPVAQSPSSWGEFVGGAATNLLQGVTLGAGDEIVAGGNALLDSVFGGPGYAARLAQARQASNRYANFAPTSSELNKLGGFLLPIPGAGKSFMGNAVKQTAVGAGIGGAAGALSADQNRGEAALEGAGVGAGIGAGLSVGAGLAGKLLTSFGLGLRNRQMGITARDYKAASDRLDLGTLGAGKERVLGALDEVEASMSRPAWYRNMGSSTENMVLNTARAADDVAAGRGQRIGEMVTDADAAISSATVPLNSQMIEDAVGGMSGLSQKQVGDDVVNRIQAFGEKPEVVAQGSTIPNWQREKVALNFQKEMANGVETAGEKLYRQSIRSGLENYIDELANQGLISGQAGEFAKVNLEYGAVQELIKGLAKDLPAAQAADLAAQLHRGAFTTSGLGVAGVNAVSEASPVMGKLALINNLISYFAPVGRVAGQAIADIGRGVSRLGATGTAGVVSANVVSDQEEPRPDMNRFQSAAIPAAIGAAIAVGPTGQPVPLPVGGLQVPASVAAVSQADPLLRSVFGDLMGRVPSITDLIQKTESAGNPKATSPKGAMGLMQLMPSTFKEVAARMGLPANADPYDPETNRAVGEQYYSEMLQKYGGSVAHALAAYNWGPGNLDRLIRRLGTDDINVLRRYFPRETRLYLAKILGQSGAA